MKKKAQGISINVIIVAVIALLVLVILSIIFMGRLGIFGTEVSKCESKNGRCVDSEEDCAGTVYSGAGYSCLDENGDVSDQLCCLPVK